MGMYSVTVPMPSGASMKAVKTMAEIALIVNDGWATFTGEADDAEEFEFILRESIDGLPEDFKAVEAW